MEQFCLVQRYQHQVCAPGDPEAMKAWSSFLQAGLGLLAASPGGAGGGGRSWTGLTGRGMPAGADGWCNRF